MYGAFGQGTEDFPKPYRLPAYGEFAGEDFFPVEWLPKNYQHYLPYVVPISNTSLANGTSWVFTFNNSNDADFILLKQQSVYDLTTVSLLVSIRIPNVRELMSDAVSYTILFPSSYYRLPFYWEIPVYIGPGESIEYTFINNTGAAVQISALLFGIKGYE